MARKWPSTRPGRYKDPKPPAALRTVTGYASGVEAGSDVAEGKRHAIDPHADDIVAMCGVKLTRRRFSPFQLGHPQSCRQCTKAIT